MPKIKRKIKEIPNMDILFSLFGIYYIFSADYI